MRFENATRIGVGGEYWDSGIGPMKGIYPELETALGYVANSGMSDVDKRHKMMALAKTFRKFGLLKGMDEEVEKLEDGDTKAEGGENKDVVEEGSASPSKGDGSDWMEELKEDEIKAMVPIHMEPGKRISPEYVKIMTEIRLSLAELDKDLSRMEESYDSTLAPQPQIPQSQSSTQEAST
jgi:hypothetical protein